jgi:hypothetical protein
LVRGKKREPLAAYCTAKGLVSFCLHRTGRKDTIFFTKHNTKMEKQHQQYQWWYTRANDWPKTIACWANSAADAVHYMIVFLPDFIGEDITFGPSPTPPEGTFSNLDNCILVGEPDALALIAIDCERAKHTHKLIQKAMYNAWPTKNLYAVIGGSLWQRTSLDTITLLQENI